MWIIRFLFAVVIAACIQGAPAKAVTISAGDVYQLDFDFTGVPFSATDIGRVLIFFNGQDIHPCPACDPYGSADSLHLQVFNAAGLQIDYYPGSPPLGNIFTLLGADLFGPSPIYALLTGLTGSVEIAYAEFATRSGYRIPATVSAVPLPAALPLLGAGLAGLGAMGWVRRRRTAAVV